MSSPSNLEHTNSRVDAAVSLEHASGSLGDCECHVHTRRCLPRGRVATIGSAESVRVRVCTLACQRDITLFWTMYEALLAAMLKLSRREQLFF